MNRKSVTYLGLPVALVLGMIAVALALGTFNSAAPPVHAGVTEVTDVEVTADPNQPGDAARYQVEFTATNQLSPSSGTITISFHQNFQVPSSLNRNDISISASAVTGDGTGGEAVAPLDVTVTVVGTPPTQQREVRLTVPDMDTEDGTGSNAIAAGADVTVIFRQSAGIMNPTQARPHATAGAYPVNVRTSADTTNVDDEVVIPRIVELSTANGPRGTVLTFIGRGYVSGTLDFWRDANGDGARSGTGEQLLCSGEVGGDNTATCTYTVSNPPFAPRLGCDPDVDLANCNLINAQDGPGNTATLENDDDPDVAAAAPAIEESIFDLRGSVTVSPAAGDPGDTVTVQLRDFPADETVTTLDLGGVPITPPAGAVQANGDLNFNIVVPDGLASGVRTLLVATATSTNRTTIFNVGGATLTVTPDTVVPNQRISLSGSGFTGGETINDDDDGSSVTIGGQPIPSNRINDGGAIEIPAGGNFTADLDLPVNASTTTAGTHELKVTDSAGREGVFMVTIPERTITITPAESGPGADITVTGENFPARNTDAPQERDSVNVQYGTGSQRSATVDSGGSWSLTIRVPTDIAVPSTNTVRATFNTDTEDGAAQVITTTSHRVPASNITLTPSSGPPGTMVTLEGTGFRSVVPVTEVLIGNIDVTPSPRPSTNAQGGVSIQFTVPGLETGTRTVRLDVGGTIASAGFTVGEDTAPPPGESEPPAEALEDLGENLVRVWHFNNETQAWTFYDPRPEFEDINTLTAIVAGQVYWVRVDEAQTATIGPCGEVQLFPNWNLIPC